MLLLQALLQQNERLVNHVVGFGLWQCQRNPALHSCSGGVLMKQFLAVVLYILALPILHSNSCHASCSPSIILGFATRLNRWGIAQSKLHTKSIDKNHRLLSKLVVLTLDNNYRFVSKLFVWSLDKNHRFLSNVLVPRLDKNHRFLSKLFVSSLDKNHTFLSKLSVSSLGNNHRFLSKLLVFKLEKNHRFLSSWWKSNNYALWTITRTSYWKSINYALWTITNYKDDMMTKQ